MHEYSVSGSSSIGAVSDKHEHDALPNRLLVIINNDEPTMHAKMKD